MSDIFGGESGEKRKKDLHSRVIEHNILIISKYYSQMQISRLATLLDLSAEEVGFSMDIISTLSHRSRDLAFSCRVSEQQASRVFMNKVGVINCIKNVLTIGGLQATNLRFQQSFMCHSQGVWFLL